MGIDDPMWEIATLVLKRQRHLALSLSSNESISGTLGTTNAVLKQNLPPCLWQGCQIRWQDCQLTLLWILLWQAAFSQLSFVLAIGFWLRSYKIQATCVKEMHEINSTISTVSYSSTSFPFISLFCFLEVACLHCRQKRNNGGSYRIGCAQKRTHAPASLLQTKALQPQPFSPALAWLLLSSWCWRLWPQQQVRLLVCPQDWRIVFSRRSAEIVYDTL